MNAPFFENYPAQGCRHPGAPRDQNSDFCMIFTMVNFRSNDSVASFVLRCQEALHRILIVAAKQSYNNKWYKRAAEEIAAEWAHSF